MITAVVGACCLLAGAVGLAARHYPARSLVPLGIAAFSPYLAPAALAAIVLFALHGGPLGTVGLALSAAVLAAHVAVRVPLYTRAPAPEGRELTVLSANLLVGWADPQAVVDAVRRHGVEVLLLQELTPQERAALGAAGLDEVLPYSVADVRDHADGTGLWSRYPLRDQVCREDFSLGFVTATVLVPGTPRPPTVGSLHLSGPHPHAAQWAADIAHLREVLRSLPAGRPALLGGDFNATTDVVQFRRLLGAGFADAGTQAGAGALRSFPSLRRYPPLIGLDHLLLRGAAARDARTVAIAGTDHRALLTHVRLVMVWPSA